MGNPIKRAARAKKATKSNKIHRHRNREKQVDWELGDKLLAIYNALPPPEQEEECRTLLFQCIAEDLQDQIENDEEISGLANLMYVMYCKWSEERRLLQA